LHQPLGLRLGGAWPALLLAVLGLLAVVAGATGGEFIETVANGSSL
jgi:hypothetical protein